MNPEETLRKRTRQFSAWIVYMMLITTLVLALNASQRHEIEKLEAQVSELESRTSAKLEAQKLGAAKLEARQRSEASLEEKETSPACLP